MVACPQQSSMAAPLLHTPLTPQSNVLTKNWSISVVHGRDPFKDALKRPITTIPPSITTTHHDDGLPSPLSNTLTDQPSPPLHAYPMFATKFKGKALISNWWVEKMGGSTARRQIGSKTSYGKGWLGVLEESRGTIWTNARPQFFLFGWWRPASLSGRVHEREM